MQELRDIQKELYPYVNEINDEFGELVNITYKILSYIDYISDDFKKALLKESSEILKTLKNDYVWSEREETITIRELIYEGDL